MTVLISAQARNAGPSAYSITISVKGSRSFTMPVEFVQGTSSIDPNPARARDIAERWVKSRAVDVARFGRLVPEHGAVLTISVPEGAAAR